MATTAAVAPLRAQPRAAPWRIGLLNGGSGIAASDPTVAWRHALQEVGYTEGVTAEFVVRSAEGHVDRLSGLAAELVSLRVDIIITAGSEATQAARRATPSIPIVFSGPSYPVEEGLVASFAHPGGNITGFTVAMSDTVSKHLQLLRDVAPTLQSVAVIWSPENPGHTFAFRDTRAAAAPLGLTVHSVPMTTAADVGTGLASIERVRPGALIVQPAPFVFAGVKDVIDLALKLHLPSISIARAFTQQGLLMSYGADFREAPRRLARYVDRILKGAKPADLPVERPTKFELVINLVTANALGLAIPQGLLWRADEVLR
jgi:putative ABC transport system substrate-binding protein